MNVSKRVFAGFSAVVLPWLLAGSATVRADDEPTFDRKPRDCVQTQAISRTEILDDQTIIFFMRGKNVAYRNFLPKKCPGLKRWERFGYSVTAGRLCSVDLITVLERTQASRVDHTDGEFILATDRGELRADRVPLLHGPFQEGDARSLRPRASSSTITSTICRAIRP